MDSEEIIYPEIKTDGVYKCYYIDDSDGMQYNYLLQLECKLDVDFNNEDERAKTLLQVICYLKQIHDNVLGYNATWESNQIPRVIVIGSKLNCFTLPSQPLIHYAMGHITGFKSASTAYMEPENRGILDNIKRDAQIKVMSIIYNTQDIDCVQSLCENIVKLARNLKITDDLNETTISKAFDYFDMNVLDKKQSSKMTSREKVSIFIGIFFSDEFSQTIEGRDATDINVLTVNGIKIKVDPDNYNKFKLLYSTRNYSRYEEKQITAITDRLIEDTDRRRKGDFYTPTIWVDEAHKLLDKNLGSNWRDECIVWDCAWGTGNLTRDYNFKELYCSTINQEELNIGARYNKNATKFQYDFLNDDVEEFEQAREALRSPFRFKPGINMQAMEQYINFRDILDLYDKAIDNNVITFDEGKLAYTKAVGILRSTKLYKVATSLVESLINGTEQGKKLLFFINPPYKGAGSGHGNTNTSDVVDTNISNLMKNNNVSGTGQLYVQFIYRMLLFKDIFKIELSIGIFSPSQILNAITLKDIRKLLRNNIGYTQGFMLQASNFANVAPGWSISFTVWGGNTVINNDTTLDVMDITNNGVEIIQKDKVIRMLEKNEKALEWIKGSKAIKKQTLPRFTSAINYTESKTYDRDEKALGTLIMDMGIVESNQSRVAIMNARSNANWTVMDITEDNFYKVIPFFAARRLIESNWINSKDEYKIPDINNNKYDVYWADSIVYTIFNNAMNVSSLRNISTYGCNLYNQFFWVSKSYIEKLAGGEFSKDDINTVVEDDLEYAYTINIQGFKYPTGNKIDIEGFDNNERYAYIIFTMIQRGLMDNAKLSPEANAVLAKATKILKKTFKYRKQFNVNHPEYHINTWDAGWYQIKALAKEYTPDDLKQFNELYKALGDRMRPLVYELGFLYK